MCNEPPHPVCTSHDQRIPIKIDEFGRQGSQLEVPVHPALCADALQAGEPLGSDVFPHDKLREIAADIRNDVGTEISQATADESSDNRSQKPATAPLQVCPATKPSRPAIAHADDADDHGTDIDVDVDGHTARDTELETTV